MALRGTKGSEFKENIPINVKVKSKLQKATTSKIYSKKKRVALKTKEPVEDNVAHCTSSSPSCTKCSTPESKVKTPTRTTCFICKETGGELLNCGGYLDGLVINRSKNRIKCQTVFHTDCLYNYNAADYCAEYIKLPECQNEILCPLHMCNTCYSERYKQSAFTNRLIQCIFCMRSFHYDVCCPTGSKDVQAFIDADDPKPIEMLICPSHFEEPLKSGSHIPVCFECENDASEETLVNCPKCVRSFHASCKSVKLINGIPVPDDICEFCLFQEVIRYDTPVMARWNGKAYFPAITREWKDCPNQLRKSINYDKLGYTTVEWLGDGKNFSICPINEIFPMLPNSVQIFGKNFSKSLKNQMQSHIDKYMNRSSRFQALKDVKKKTDTSRYHTKNDVGAYFNEAFKCDCKADGVKRCSTVECSNRSLMVECLPECHDNGTCHNRCVSDKIVNKKIERRVTEKKGYGVFATETIKKGEFIAEYAGEIISKAEKERRSETLRRARDKEANLYMMELTKGRAVDASKMGNIARYINHSCEPNCKVINLMIYVSSVKQYDIRPALYADKDIKKDEELCFNYGMSAKLENMTAPACNCGSAKCCGTLGSKSQEPTSDAKKTKEARKLHNKTNAKTKSLKRKNRKNAPKQLKKAKIDATKKRAIHTTGAPKHFERVAQNLLEKRTAHDHSTCDLRIELKHGVDMVHSAIVAAHSNTLSTMLENTCPPYPSFDMTLFNADSVRRVINWMYSGEIDVPGHDLKEDLTVAAYLRVPLLQREFEQHLKKIAEQGDYVFALNVASSHQYSVSTETMKFLVMQLYNNMPKLTTAVLQSLELNAIVAMAASLLPSPIKVPLLNLAIKWLNLRKYNRNAINSIVHGMIISDLTCESLYNIKCSLLQYLLNPRLCQRTVLSQTQDGQISINLEDRASHAHRSSSTSCLEPSQPQEIDKPKSRSQKLTGIRRTQSEVDMVNALPDPFDKNFSIPNGNQIVYYRRGTDGYPKVFTKSEVDLLQNMDDPFEKSSKPKVSKSKSKSSTSSRILGRTKSQIDDIQKIPDPFQNTPRRTESEENMIRNIPNPFHRQNIAQRSLAEIKAINALPDPFTKKVGSNSNSNNVKKCNRRILGRTKSEIEDIQNLSDPFEKSEYYRVPSTNNRGCLSTCSNKSFLQAQSPKPLLRMPSDCNGSVFVFVLQTSPIKDRPDFVVSMSTAVSSPRPTINAVDQFDELKKFEEST
ncbi:unnamed protein product [Caenorhabditis bovis]|uniref:SET domain-containing protein n=1 Tax=Caenorhabditis bovis TaxID=2654633 RepID=A0A8S1EK72_9PELO|nr:unnamed protein product [Caenorhabditis bovis]